MLIFQELLKPSASSSDPLPFKLLPKLVKTSNGTSTSSANSLSDPAPVSSGDIKDIETFVGLLILDKYTFP